MCHFEKPFSTRICNTLPLLDQLPWPPARRAYGSESFTKHMSVRQFPRLITEVIRGTGRHQKLKALRSASERTNSSAKNDFCILNKPKIRGIKNAGTLSASRYNSFNPSANLCFKYLFPIPDFRYFSLRAASASFRQPS